MIAEDYVSFAVSKLLIVKGFDIDECEVHYDPEDHTQYEITIQMAMKWLRKEHKVYIMIDRSFSMEDSWHYCICVNDDFDNLIQQETQPHRKYEEAGEAAIKYCLENLI